MRRPHKSLTVLLFCLFFSYIPHSFAANNDWVNINGTVTYNGTPVCTMVLANGQYMFTCSGDGSFDLDVPLDPDTGQITVFAFCEGLAPFEQVIFPSEGQGMQIEMAAGGGGSGMNVTSTLMPINSSWVRLEGTVSYNSNPACAMVLANGQYMFTCSGDGSYSLDVPLDPADGSVTLFSFCSGLPPYKYVYTSDQISFDDDTDNDGYSINEGDCHDLDPSINPDATEICGDGIDQNCDGNDRDCNSGDDGDGCGEWLLEKTVTTSSDSETIVTYFWDANKNLTMMEEVTNFNNSFLGHQRCEIYLAYDENDFLIKEETNCTVHSTIFDSVDYTLTVHNEVIYTNDLNGNNIKKVATVKGSAPSIQISEDITLPSVNFTFTITVDMEYDSCGNVTKSITKSNANEITTSSDPIVNAFLVAFLATMGDIGNADVIIVNTYDSQCNILTSTSYSGDGIVVILDYTYNSSGKVESITATTDQGTYIQTYEYDACNRISKMTNHGDSLSDSVTIYIYKQL